MFYILDENHQPIKVASFTDVIDWLKQNENADLIAFDEVKGIEISTRFFATLDPKTGWPVFETNIAVSDVPLYFKRYASWQEAAVEHQKIVKEIAETCTSQ